MAERVMSAAGLVFKGSGFYITDYGKDGKKPQATEAPAAKPAETDAAKPAAESKPKASEAKPEAKPAPAPKKAE